MYGGHLNADPNITRAASTDITPHLYFFMVKNRRTADRERIVFWFNVCHSMLYVLTESDLRYQGWSRMFVVRRCDDGGWSMAVGWQIRPWFLRKGGWLGGIYYYGVWYVVYNILTGCSPNFNAVDQPAGTGFSYTSTDNYVKTMDIVSSILWPYRCAPSWTRTWQAQQHILEFMKNFYKVFPEYKNVDVRPLLSLYYLVSYIYSDIPCGRELRWPMDTLLWYIRYPRNPIHLLTSSRPQPTPF